jgi:hypothetical protein
MAHLLAEMKADIRTNRAKTDVDLKETIAKLDSNQKEIRASKEETKVAILHPLQTGRDHQESDGESPDVCRPATNTNHGKTTSAKRNSGQKIKIQ